jgi:hypothetical protein
MFNAVMIQCRGGFSSPCLSISSYFLFSFLVFLFPYLCFSFPPTCIIFFYLFLVYGSNFSSIFFRMSLSHSLYRPGDIQTELTSPGRMSAASQHSTQTPQTTDNQTDKQLEITFCITNIILIKTIKGNNVTLSAPASIGIKLRNELYSTKSWCS